MYKKNWLLMVAMVMILGCRDDDDTFETRIIKFSVPDNYIQANNTYWIAMSDNAGEILDSKRLENGKTYTFILPPAAASVNLTTVWDRGNAEYIGTYTDVPPGEYGFPATVASPALGEPASLFIEMPDPQNFVFQTRGTALSIGTEIIEHPTPGRRFLVYPAASKNSMTFLLMAFSKPPFKYMYTHLESNQSYTRTQADFQTTALKRIGVQPADFTDARISGINSDGKFAYFDSSGENVERPTETAINLPDMPQLFTSYIVDVTLNDWSARVNHGYVAEHKTLPDSIPMLEGTIENLQIDDESVSWETRSNEEITMTATHASGFLSDGSYAVWSVYGPGGKQRVVLPRILGLNTETTFASLATKVLWATMEVSLEHDNYQDYMVRNLLPDVYERERLYKRVSKQLAP